MHSNLLASRTHPTVFIFCLSNIVYLLTVYPQTVGKDYKIFYAVQGWTSKASRLFRVKDEAREERTPSEKRSLLKPD